MKFLGIFLLLNWTIPVGWAQSETSSAARPVPPFFAELPVAISWTITYKRAKPTTIGADASAQDPVLALLFARPIKTEVIKSGVRISRVTEMTSGRKAISYYYKNTEYFIEPNFVGDDAATRDVSQDPTTTGLRLDFPELSWVSAESFEKEATLEGRKCYVFAKSNSPPVAKAEVDPRIEEARRREIAASGESANTEKTTEPERVYIEVKTLLPLKLVSGDTEAIYDFQGKRSFPNPPPAIQRVIKNQSGEAVLNEMLAN